MISIANYIFSFKEPVKALPFHLHKEEKLYVQGGDVFEETCMIPRNYKQTHQLANVNNRIDAYVHQQHDV